MQKFGAIDRSHEMMPTRHVHATELYSKLRSIGSAKSSRVHNFSKLKRSARAGVNALAVSAALTATAVLPVAPSTAKAQQAPPVSITILDQNSTSFGIIFAVTAPLQSQSNEAVLFTVTYQDNSASQPATLGSWITNQGKFSDGAQINYSEVGMTPGSISKITVTAAYQEYDTGPYGSYPIQGDNIPIGSGSATVAYKGTVSSQSNDKRVNYTPKITLSTKHPKIGKRDTVSVTIPGFRGSGYRLELFINGRKVANGSKRIEYAWVPKKIERYTFTATAISDASSKAFTSAARISSVGFPTHIARHRRQ